MNLTEKEKLEILGHLDTIHVVLDEIESKVASIEFDLMEQSSLLRKTKDDLIIL